MSRTWLTAKRAGTTQPCGAWRDDGLIYCNDAPGHKWKRHSYLDANCNIQAEWPVAMQEVA